MGRLSKARLAAKARNAANRMKLVAEEDQSPDSGSQGKSLLEVPEAVRTTATTLVNENASIEEELKVHMIPKGKQPKNLQECEDNQLTLEAISAHNPRRAGKAPKCCEEDRKVPKKRQPRCKPFDLWSDEVQRQLAADAKPQVGSVYKQLLKRWSRLPRIQKNYWKHRAKLVNEVGKTKVCLEREKKKGRKAKPKADPKPKEKKNETVELMVEMLPVKQEEEEEPPSPVVLVYSAYTLWLLNLRRSVSPEFSDQLGAGSKLAVQLWEGLPMKEKVAWNNRALQVNGMLRYGWERAMTYALVRKFVLGEKESDSGQLTIASVQSLAEPVVVKQEPNAIPAGAVGCIKLVSDSLSIVGDYLKDCESPDVASSITWLIGSLHSTLEPLSAIAHGMNLPALQGNVEQLRKLFQQQKL